MSDPEEVSEAEVEDVAEPRQMSERTARAILLVIAVGAMWGLVAVAPWVAYVVVGVFGTLGWQKVRGWIVRRRDDEGETEAGETEAGVTETWRVPTFHELCESLAHVGTPHAHIAVLAHDLGTTPERVREALDACGVPVEAVRMQGRGSSTGVKGGALPTPRSVVGAGQPADNDNNNGSGKGPEEGLSVEDIGLAGTLIREPAETAQRRTNVTDLVDRFFTEAARRRPASSRSDERGEANRP